MLRDAFGLIFTGENNNRLKELVDRRAIGAIPFAGRYRVIDFILSNMVNSGISNVGVITQFNYHSLMDHIGTGKEWDLNRKKDGLFLLPPFYQSGQASSYRGRVEALKAVMQYITRASQQYCIFTGSHVVYSMRYDEAFDFHIANGADITLIYNDLSKGKVYDDIFENLHMELDPKGRVVDMQFLPRFSDSTKVCLDTYIIEKTLLGHLVDDCISRGKYGFISDLIMTRMKNLKVYAYEYKGYAARIDSVLSYYKHNLDVLDPDVRKNLFYSSGPVFTKIRDEVPAKYGENASVSNCVLADGCVIDGTVENSVLFRGVLVDKGAVIRDSIVMQDCEVGENTHLENVILDKEVLVRRGRVIRGSDNYPVIIKKGSIV